MNLLPPVSRPRRRPSLTPMIDVVFLLLVFFMLASRFGLDAVIPMPLASGGGAYEGPPRIVDILPEEVRLNGIPLEDAELAEEMQRYVTGEDDVIVLRGTGGASLQRVVSVGSALRAAGFTQMVLIE